MFDKTDIVRFEDIFRHGKVGSLNDGDVEFLIHTLTSGNNIALMESYKGLYRAHLWQILEKISYTKNDKFWDYYDLIINRNENIEADIQSSSQNGTRLYNLQRKVEFLKGNIAKPKSPVKILNKSQSLES